VNETRRSARWSGSMAALVLAAGLALPAAARADHKGEGDGQGVCSLMPNGCRRQDCRCDSDKTCTRCQKFSCRSGRKQLVVCRPCCKGRYGSERCKRSDDDERRCVPSPS